MSKKLFIIFFTVFIAISWTSAQTVSSMSEAQKNLYNMGFEIPQQKIFAADFFLQTLDNKNISLSSLKGKIVFLNFWATWCPPCITEMPSIQRLYNNYKNKDFEILAVTQGNSRETRSEIDNFIKKNGYTFPVLLDNTGNTNTIYDINGIPTTYIIDKNGEILAR